MDLPSPNSPQFLGLAAYIAPPFEFHRGGKNYPDSFGILSLRTSRPWPYMLGAGRRRWGEYLCRAIHIDMLNLNDPDAKSTSLQLEWYTTRIHSASIDSTNLCYYVDIFVVCIRRSQICELPWNSCLWRLRSYRDLGNVGGMSLFY